MNKISTTILVPLLLLGSLAGASGLPAEGGQSGAAAAGSACLAVSDGGGIVRLLWPVPRTGWPAGGWQIVDESGKELKRVRAGQGRTPASFPAEKAALLQTLAKGLPSFSSDEERESFFFVLLAEIVTDPAFAEAAAFAAVLEKLPPGRRSYRVLGLTLEGKQSGRSYRSPAVDSGVPTPPPPAPGAVKATSAAPGVLLFWAAAAEPAGRTALVFHVERKTESGAFSAVGKPMLSAVNAAPDAPAFLDPDAPLGKTAEYRIFAADAFGRRSAPAEVSVLHYDHAALEPPDGLDAKNGPGRTILEWKAADRPRTGRIVIWRALRPAGPYASLTPEGLPGATTRYEDTDVKGGIAYYYRIQVIGEDRLEGPKSVVVSASPKNAAAPARPEGLTAELERTRVRLSWKAPAGALLAGFLIERRDKNGVWARLNERISAETIYHDYGGAEGPARWSYRIRAVALDNLESAPSATVEVVVPDRSIPPTPEVVSADGGGGKTVVRFRPGQPEAKSVQFVVLRSGDPRDIGVVMGRPLAAAAREYTDPFVEAGGEYWYRVVAISPNGNRSEPSAAVWVRIGPPPIPAPPAPKAELILKPSPRVRITFAPAPQGLETVLQRKLPAEKDWVILSAVSRGGEIVDADPPASGKAEYRIVYRTRSGVYGPASPAVFIQR